MKILANLGIPVAGIFMILEALRAGELLSIIFSIVPTGVVLSIVALGIVIFKIRL